MESSFDIVTRIAERIDQLSLSEQKVARWILADLSVAGAASIDTLAEQAGVSKASVTRFAKALGCTDVRELKRRLTQAAAIGSRFLQPRPDAPADSADVVYQDIMSMLQANRALVNMDVIKRAALAVRHAGMVYAFGMGGGSTVAADEARFRLVRFGIPVSTYQDAVLQRVVAATMDSRAVVLAFSVTGQVPEMLTSVRIAREYGAQVIAITALGSPLAGLADHLLPIQIMETDFVFKPSSSRYAMLMMLDILATEVAMLEHAQAQELLRRIKYVLDTGRGGDDRQPLGD